MNIFNAKAALEEMFHESYKGDLRQHICPLSWNACVGPRNCAPAILAAIQDNDGRDIDTEELSEPSCPIVDATTSLVRASAIMVQQSFSALVEGERVESDQDRKDDILEGLTGDGRRS